MSQPNLKEIEWAISELEQSESSFSNYARLADLYTVRNQMLGDIQPEQPVAAYSDMGIPVSETLGQYGDSEFLRAVAGKDSAAAWAVMDELMDTLRVVKARAYENVMRKLSRL